MIRYGQLFMAEMVYSFLMGWEGGGVMLQPKTFHTFARVTKIVLMALLIGFELVLNLPGSDAAYINQAALQLTRSQILVNAVYTLAYRPAAEQGQARQDLTTVLAAFKQEQAVLFSNPVADVQDLLQQARIDYLPLVAAVQSIIAQPSSVVDPIEVNIIALHEHNYLITMNALLLVLPRHFEDRNIQLFVLQIVIEVLFLVLFVVVITTFVWEMHIQKREQTTPKPLQIAFFVRRLIVFVLVIVLAGLEIVPLGISDKAAYLDQAARQRTRCEVLAKSALVLAYRPAAEQAQAQSDMQVIGPLFQQEQAVLAENRNGEVQRAVLAAQGEYEIVWKAAQPPTSTTGKAMEMEQVNTLVAHAGSCVAQMDKIVQAVQRQMEQQATLIFSAEVAIEGAFIIFFAALLLFARDPFVPQDQRRARGYVL